MRKALWVLGIVVALLLVGAIIAAAWAVNTMESEEDVTVTRTAVEGSFDEIAELSVEEYNFTNVGQREDAGRVLFGRNIPLTGNSFLLTYSGVVKAGVDDFEAVGVRIDDEARQIAVSVPKVRVTSSDIDPDSITVYDQSMNPFNQVEVQDFSDFIAEEKRVAEDKAVEAGLLERAEDRVEQLMVSHVEALTEGTQQDGYAVEVDWK